MTQTHLRRILGVMTPQIWRQAVAGFAQMRDR
jgi:hypothetical protein